MQPSLRSVRHTSADHGDIELNVASLGDPSDPLILCIHGWPESWHSWRHQMSYFSELGYCVAAMDVRGYGASSRPKPIEAYRLSELSADAAAVIEALSPDGTAIVFGHDWGAPIAWNTARLHPERVSAVAGMSVPYTPVSPGDPMEFWDLVYPDAFFYMRYFAEPGVAEAAFSADLPSALRKVYYAASADSPADAWHAPRPRDHAMLDDLVDPDPAPEWMSPEALASALESHGSGPIHGWFNRYRAQALDGDDIGSSGDPILRQPTTFIAGTEDVVRRFVPGVDFFAEVDGSLSDFRGKTLIEDAGHWVQQEQPDATNAALHDFIRGL